MKKAITVTAFEAADDLKTEWFPLPAEYGEEAGVYIRAMMSSEGSEIEDEVVGRDLPVNTFRRLVLKATIVDEDSKPIFGDDTIDVLMTKNRSIVEAMFERSCKLNGFSRKDVEELEGNSESGPSD